MEQGSDVDCKSNRKTVDRIILARTETESSGKSGTGTLLEREDGQPEIGTQCTRKPTNPLCMGSVCPQIEGSPLANHPTQAMTNRGPQDDSLGRKLVVLNNLRGNILGSPFQLGLCKTPTTENMKWIKSISRGRPSPIPPPMKKGPLHFSNILVHTHQNWSPPQMRCQSLSPLHDGPLKEAHSRAV